MTDDARPDERAGFYMLTRQLASMTEKIDNSVRIGQETQRDVRQTRDEVHELGVRVARLEERGKAREQRSDVIVSDISELKSGQARIESSVVGKLETRVADLEHDRTARTAQVRLVGLLAGGSGAGIAALLNYLMGR